MPSGAEPRLVDARGLATRRSAALLARGGLARRARPSSPPSRRVESRGRPRLAVVRRAGSATQAPHDKSDTTPRARARGRSRAVLSSERDLGGGARFRRHRADPAVRRRSAGSDQGQPWKRGDIAALVFRPHSVHQFHLGRTSGAAAVHSDFRRFAGISCPLVSVRERSKHPRPSMVRKGSSVRVRQGAPAFSC